MGVFSVEVRKQRIYLLLTIGMSYKATEMVGFVPHTQLPRPTYWCGHEVFVGQTGVFLAGSFYPVEPALSLGWATHAFHSRDYSDNAKSPI